MTSPDELGILVRLELLERVLADRLQHPEPLAVPLQQAVVDERRDAVEGRVAHGDRGLQGEASADGQPSEELLLLGAQEVVAPGIRVAQRSVALGEVAGAAAEQVEPLVEQREHRLRGQELRAGRCELDRKRKAVEASTISFTASAFSSVSRKRGSTP